MQRHAWIRLIILVMSAALTLSAPAAERGAQQPIYRVTLAPAASVDGVEKVAGELAAMYRGTLVMERRGMASDSFALHLSPEEARVLAADPRVTGIVPLRAGTVVADAVETVGWTSGVSFAYDGAGDITQIGDDRFVYDDIGRLVNPKVNTVSRTYAYDA